MTKAQKQSQKMSLKDMFKIYNWVFPQEMRDQIKRTELYRNNSSRFIGLTQDEQVVEFLMLSVRNFKESAFTRDIQNVIYNRMIEVNEKTK